MHKVRASTFLRTFQGDGSINGFVKGGSRLRYSSRRSDDNVAALVSRAGDSRQSDINSIRSHDSYEPSFKNDLDGFVLLLQDKLMISWLYIFLPVSLYTWYFHCGASWEFWPAFLALIPLASLLGDVTEELAFHTGDLLGGLINATMGNIVEMIITVQSLRIGLVEVVQGALLGSIFSNLLLVLGCSFLAGGTRYYTQKFNATGAQASTSLLLIGSLAFVVPSVMKADDGAEENVLTTSRIIAILIGTTYCLYLFFQYWTHLGLFSSRGSNDVLPSESMDDDQMDAILSLKGAIVCLGIVTIVVSFVSQILVESIEGVSTAMNIPTSFIGVILLPIVGNAAEHFTAVTVALRNKVDLTMGIAVGSSTQIAMLMVPFSVLIGWAMDVNMTLAISPASCLLLALSVIIVMSVVQDGESNWMEGVLLVVAYIIVAVMYWFDKV